MYQENASALLRFIEKCPSPFHVIHQVETLLEGYTPLREEENWHLEPGKGYYVNRNSSSLIAFRLPEGVIGGYQIGAAHSDCPVFKVKPKGEMKVEGHYVKLNVEKYGGMLLTPWLDRPLSVAGRILVREQGRIVQKLVNIDRNLCIIPNVAIHMNRQANDGLAFNPQIDLLPLMGDETAEGSLLSMIAQSAGVEAADILGSDLFLYNRMKGIFWGSHNEYIASRSLDDLQCAWSLMQGFLTAAPNPDRVAMCCIFDNEEVGSLSRQGADSTFLRDVMERINEAVGGNPQTLRAAVANSFMVSADNAHAVHPNHPEKADPTNRPYMNEGIVIKYNANQKYTTDGVSGAIFQEFCRRAQVPTQTYANRSDIPGGSTLGNLSNRHVSLSTADVGLPQLAMHSPFESAGVKDTTYLVKAMQQVFGGGVKRERDGISLL